MVYLNASAVAAILNEGMMVGVRLGLSSLWHGNIIYGINSNIINIAYIDKFMKDIAVPECPVFVKYSNDYFIYYFRGSVKNVSTEHPQYISVKIDTAEEIINSRLFPRYDVRIKASLKPVWDDEVYRCTVTDLSYSGAAFICNHLFDGNEQLEMSLNLPTGSTVLVSGKVVRRKNAQSTIADHAVQFIECDNVNNILLSEYFSQLDDEASKIYLRYIKDVKGKI